MPRSNFRAVVDQRLRRIARSLARSRGTVFFVALVAFTLLYAVVLQWLSSTRDEEQGNVASIMRAPPATARAAVPAAAAVPTAAAVPSATAVPSADAVASAAAVALAPATLAPAPFERIDDDVPGTHGERFTYVGSWEHIKNMRDGRSEGTSARSYQVGASAYFQFLGERLEIFGVKGRTGGYAELRIDGSTYGLLHFYSPKKEAGALIYSSPVLEPGTHTAEIIVAEPPEGYPKRRYVNLDGAAYAAR
jgi:hypothetical protein